MGRCTSRGAAVCIDMPCSLRSRIMPPVTPSKLAKAGVCTLCRSQRRRSGIVFGFTSTAHPIFERFCPVNNNDRGKIGWAKVYGRVPPAKLASYLVAPASRRLRDDQQPAGRRHYPASKLSLSSARNLAGSTYSKHCISGLQRICHTLMLTVAPLLTWISHAILFSSERESPSYVFRPGEGLETPSAGILTSTCIGLLPRRRLGGDDPPPGGPLPGGSPGKHASLVKPRILVVDD